MFLCAETLPYKLQDVRIHQTLRLTPAMESGPCDHAWDLAELVHLPRGNLAEAV
jgi:hypothetical protein